MIALLPTELINKVLRRRGVIIKQQNAMIDPSTSFVLNCALKISVVSQYRFPLMVSGKELNKQNALSISEHSVYMISRADDVVWPMYKVERKEAKES
ncbi:hypothetical protein Trydic_g12018, partial [Trypoxylus dichotomus]